MSATASALWRALGTNVHVLVADGDLAIARVAVEEVLSLVDATYSRFRADSELRRLSTAGGERVRVSGLLARAIGEGLRAAAATDGLVDPTVGRAVRATGYDADFASIDGRAHGPVVRFEWVPGWRAVSLDPRARTVRVPPGVEIDLDATGKALAADLAAAAAADALNTDAGVLVSLGGDIALAGRTPVGGWHVAVGEDSGADPRDLDEVVTLSAGAIATSSTTVRRWRRGGAEVHHIIDPRTGAPAAGPWRTATVVAGNCVDANAAATASIVLGADAPGWLERRGLPARLIATYGAVVRVSGWPEPASGALPSPHDSGTLSAARASGAPDAGRNAA